MSADDFTLRELARLDLEIASLRVKLLELRQDHGTSLVRIAELERTNRLLREARLR